MSWGAIVVGVVGGVVSLSQGAANRAMAKDQAKAAAIAQEEARKRLDREKAAYRAIKIVNPYADLENVYEDLTVNQQQAQFESQQMAQTRSNVMEGLRGAAGASGIASLAQAMANQGQLATQRISASMGQQEAVNQRLAARGAGAAQMAERKGAAWQQQAQMSRQATILGMELGMATGANQAAMMANKNEMNAMIANQQNLTNVLGIVGEAAGEVDWGSLGSGSNG
jgi:hypothetical protein